MEELVAVDDPAWPALLEEVATSDVTTRMLPSGEVGRGRTCLHELQVSARSWLGAMALHSGGLLIDHGWVRVLGGSSGLPGMPDLLRANALPETTSAYTAPSLLIVAYDVLGGVFAIKGGVAAAGSLPGEPGHVLYFAPDCLEWESLELGYGSWLCWLLSGRLTGFYESFRWSGWQEETASLPLDQGVSFAPPLWSAEAQHDIDATDRRPAPLTELLDLHREVSRQSGLSNSGPA
ncbi:DUF2625 family protein [Streptosporangium sp. NPDC001681]|uniref:DUF2625 family protein n=1 Tax=Streptosporangium sp. NPDC001681 TaxID=3154395 RepID=UPI003317F5C4